MTPPSSLLGQPFLKGKADKIVYSKRLTRRPLYVPFKWTNDSPFKSYGLAKYDLIFYFYFYTGESKMNFLYYAMISRIVYCYVCTV